MDTEVHQIPVSIQELRARGYVFRSYLESRSEALTQQWAGIRPRAIAAMDQDSRQISLQADALQQRLSLLRQIRDDGQLGAAESTAADLDARIRAARDAIRQTYEPLQLNTRQTAGQIKEIMWVLDEAEGATFKLYQGEGVVSAVKSQWMTNGREGPRGILYLTEERLLFEQKEEIAIRKTLFITREKRKLQELRWEVPLGHVTSVRAAERGGSILGIGKRELLELEFAGGANVQRATLRLDADSEPWQSLIGRVKSGDIAGERTFPKDKTLVEAARAVPTRCSNCGALITQPIVKGMTENKCDYCGAVTRL